MGGVPFTTRHTVMRTVEAPSTVRYLSALSAAANASAPRRCPVAHALTTSSFATLAVYHVQQDGWKKISANDSGMEMHYEYAEEGFGAQY